MGHHLISLMILIPVIGTLFQAFLPTVRGVPRAALGRWAAVVASLLSGLCGLVLVASMQTQTPGVQLSESLPWIGSYAINYEVGVDGLNALLVLLVSLLFPVVLASEWEQKLGARGMHGLFLLLQSSLLGAVCAQDLFLQFFFWAFTAFPVYFLVGIWGGKDRETAAFRSVVTACIGNALLFSALVLIYYSVDPHTFLLRELAGGKLNGKVFEFLGREVSVPAAAFALIGAGLALRAPVWPLHAWFTKLAEEASPSVLVVVSGAVVPVATYIFVRLTYSLFPETLLVAAPAIVAVGALGLLMGGVCALAQRGLRTLLSFLCVAQVGMTLLGLGSLSSAGLVGAVYLQLVFGLGLAGFGLLSGLIIERAGHCTFSAEGGERSFGGIAMRAPAVAVAAGVVVASLLGVPGFGGFVGSSLVLIGSYSAQPGAVVLSGAMMILSAYCLFTMYRQIFLGKEGGATATFPDLGLRERAYVLPVVFGLLLLGIYPKPFLDLVRPTALTLLSAIK